MQPKMRQGSSNDFQTPARAILPLLKYIPKEWTIWECASGKGNLIKAFKEKGYKIIGTDILNGYDFMMYEIKKYDCIITNPPFSYKQQFLERAYLLKKPFAFLLPLTTFETEKRQKLFKKYYEYTKFIFMNKRINFITPSGAGSGSWFATMWVCYKIELPQILNYYKFD